GLKRGHLAKFSISPKTEKTIPEGHHDRPESRQRTLPRLAKDRREALATLPPKLRSPTDRPRRLGGPEAAVGRLDDAGSSGRRRPEAVDRRLVGTFGCRRRGRRAPLHRNDLLYAGQGDRSPLHALRGKDRTGTRPDR